MEMRVLKEFHGRFMERKRQGRLFKSQDAVLKYQRRSTIFIGEKEIIRPLLLCIATICRKNAILLMGSNCCLWFSSKNI
jgi:hypothetical protein